MNRDHRFVKLTKVVMIVLISFVSFYCSCLGLSAGALGFLPPASSFYLAGWKLQLPGPQEVPDLREYCSKYFFLNPSNEMCFWVDCSETGSTANSTYVRSELRHLKNWSINGPHSVEATIRVCSQAVPNKVTVLQIHGITASGDNAPPLLRVAMNDGSLYAFIKKDNFGDQTEKVELASNIGNRDFNCRIRLENSELIIMVNKQERIRRNMAFWKYSNYFKAGCYPQAHRGAVTVAFSSLSVK